MICGAKGKLRKRRRSVRYDLRRERIIKEKEEERPLCFATRKAE